MKKLDFQAIKAELEKKAKEFQEQLEGNESKITLFLLGSSYPKAELEKRKQVSKELVEKTKFNIILMEELHEWTLLFSKKFKGIINKFKPDLYIIIFTKNGHKSGVTFEIGFLCGFFGYDVIVNKLHFCIEEGIEMKVLTEYIQEIISEAKIHYFSDNKTLINSIIHFGHDKEKELGYIQEI